MIDILTGDARAVLPTLPDGHFHTCVTSPPYFGLRDYGNPAQMGLEQTPAGNNFFASATRRARKAGDCRRVFMVCSIC